MTDFNDRVIAEFRANRGVVTTGGFGTKLVLIHSSGARSGTERVNPALSVRDGENRLVIASAAGRASNPGWYYNLIAHPDITIETAHGTEHVTAVELDGNQYAEAWRRFDDSSPAFARYQQQAWPRRLPIFRLVQRSPKPPERNTPMSTTTTFPQTAAEPVGADSVLWQPVQIGGLRLPHRLAMAPMTRDRSAADGSPTDLNVEYYRQRASAALIITEGTQPSADGQGYLLTPGIYTDEHLAGWARVADAVHAEGGQLVVQLMHVGRIAHPDNTPHHRQPVAPSAVAANTQMFTAAGMQPMPEPRALSTDEVAATVGDYRHAAACAMRAGADGVEIHGANGYLIHQFLSTNANQRSDRYGGSILNRIRFAVEVAEAVADEIGAERTGFQISPGNPFNDVTEDDAPELYSALIAAVAPLRLAYLNIAHGEDGLRRFLGEGWPTAVINNRAGAAIPERVADIESGLADVITVGTRALANPDLVERIKTGAPLNAPDRDTFYGGGERGYTDYPTLDQPAARS